MKQLLLFVLLITSITFTGLAQDANAKIEAARIALITERLNLTPDQAEKFWPIYKEYTNKRRDINQQFRSQVGNVDPNTVSDEEAKKLVQMQLEKKQQELNLEKQYSERILSVISTRQMVSLRKAEQDFKILLMEKIKQRQQMQRNRIQNQQKLNQRRNN